MFGNMTQSLFYCLVVVKQIYCERMPFLFKIYMGDPLNDEVVKNHYERFMTLFNIVMQIFLLERHNFLC